MYNSTDLALINKVKDDKKIIEILYNKKTELIKSISKKIYTKYKKDFELYLIDYDELFSVAYESMVIAVKSFNSKNNKDFDLFFEAVYFCTAKRRLLYYNCRNNKKSDVLNMHNISRDFPEEDTLSTDVEEEIISKISKENIWDIINKKLSEREVDFLKLKFIDNMSCNEIADKYKLTRQRVSYIIIRALKKIKKDKRVCCL